MIGDGQEDIEDEVIYEISGFFSIDDIAGMEYESEPVEGIDNDNAEPFVDMVDEISVVTSESVEVDPRKNTISNI